MHGSFQGRKNTHATGAVRPSLLPTVLPVVYPPLCPSGSGVGLPGASWGRRERCRESRGRAGAAPSQDTSATGSSQAGVIEGNLWNAGLPLQSAPAVHPVCSRAPFSLLIQWTTHCLRISCDLSDTCGQNHGLLLETEARLLGTQEHSVYRVRAHRRSLRVPRRLQWERPMEHELVEGKANFCCHLVLLLGTCSWRKIPGNHRHRSNS